MTHPELWHCCRSHGGAMAGCAIFFLPTALLPMGAFATHPSSMVFKGPSAHFSAIQPQGPGDPVLSQVS